MISFICSFLLDVLLAQFSQQFVHEGEMGLTPTFLAICGAFNPFFYNSAIFLILLILYDPWTSTCL